jgi:hypothetical protein
MIDKLILLKGQTLSTLAKNKKFTVEVVDEAGIIIRVLSTEKNRTISWDEIEKAWEYLQLHGTITQTQILDMGTRSSAYIVVFLSTLPGVSYQLNPIRLIFQK